MAIECKWSADRFDATNLVVPAATPQGENVVLATEVKTSFHQNYGALKVRFEGLESFAARLTSS